ncbi:type IV pilus modification PilV family protein [Bacillus sp. 2205SS5-2]|uniref:type IV pilus modification PilV family protein n=1 Tax=Bacillus sp. 2205SS5-2 TaxID=3109031 RepID=UPI003006464B
MKLLNYLKNNRAFTLLELLVSITILSIVLLSFMNFFLQAGTHTNLNQKKTVAINVARNALMFMEQQNFLQLKDIYAGVHNGTIESDSFALQLVICDSAYQYFDTKSTAPETCESISINNLSYDVSIFSEKLPANKQEDYYIPITIEVRWEVNDRDYHTTLDGTIKSEDIRS